MFQLAPLHDQRRHQSRQLMFHYNNVLHIIQFCTQRTSNLFPSILLTHLCSPSKLGVSHFGPYIVAALTYRTSKCLICPFPLYAFYPTFSPCPCTSCMFYTRDIEIKWTKQINEKVRVTIAKCIACVTHAGSAAILTDAFEWFAIKAPRPAELHNTQLFNCRKYMRQLRRFSSMLVQSNSRKGEIAVVPAKVVNPLVGGAASWEA